MTLPMVLFAALGVLLAATGGPRALLLLASVAATLAVALGAAPRPSASWPRPFALIRALIRRSLEIFGSSIVTSAPTAAAINWLAAALGTAAGHVLCWRHGVSLEPLELLGLEHVWLKPKGPDQAKEEVHATRVVLLYFHGGGYALLNPRLYIPMACELRTAVQRALDAVGDFQLDVLLANYRKPPTHRFPSAAEDATAIYEHLINVENLPADCTLVAGDSAGAGLAMSVMLRTKRQQTHPQPRAALLLCPFVDLSDSKETDAESDGRAPYCILSSKFVRAAKDAYLPLQSVKRGELDASAVHCDLSGLPPAIVQVGSLDLLLPQSRALIKRASGSWKLDEHALMPHAFMVFPSLVMPHVKVSHRRLARFVAAQFASFDTQGK